jgi:hypothetical protein
MYLKRSKRMKLKITAMIGGFMLLASTAFALPGMWSVFQTNYKPSKTGAITKASCVVCHVSKGKVALNPYGEDVKTALKGSKTLTPEILKSIESKDSDKDGVSNADEIKADSLPGDPKSKPAK